MAIERMPGFCALCRSRRHSRHRNLPRLRRHSPEPLVELHPSAAGVRGMVDGDLVVVETPRAAMRARAKLNATLAPDVIWAQFGWFEVSYNDLIDPDAADPISGTVALRSHLCEVLKDGG
jgi:anaerobic selenocysteine-containing dehydrogenase